MSDLFTDQDLDHFVWSLLSTSSNPSDYINFIKLSYNRQVDQEQALLLADKYWLQKDQASLFSNVMDRLGDLANDGNQLACFYLARLNRLGIGTESNLAQAIYWYEKGVDFGSTRCMIALARTIAKDSPERASSLLNQALELGDVAANCFLADFEKLRHDELLELGGSSDDGFAVYSWGHHLLKSSQTDAERSKAIDILKRSARLGEASACNLLVYGYLYGSYGVEKDNDSAAYWARQGIKLGCDSSYSLLGRVLIGSPETEQDALQAWKSASMLGDDFAQCALGWRLVMFGDSSEKQHEGIQWLREAAKQGNKSAIYRLADFLKDGKGVDKNEVEAIELIQRGVKLGSAECQASLAVSYLFGDQVEVDKERAHNLLQLSKLQGYAWGTYLLGMTYEQGDGVPQSIDKAIDCFKEIADEEPRAAYRLGYLSLWRDEDNQDLPAAAKWFMSAADRGNADAQLHLGIMLLNGYGVEESASKALKWFKLAANQDNRSANRELGLLYVEGNGVTRDRDLGMRYLAKAASMGDEASQKWLDENCPKKPQWLLDMRAE
jgi:TPR repeat protein